MRPYTSKLSILKERTTMRLSYVSVIFILVTIVVGCSSFQTPTQPAIDSSTNTGTNWVDTFDISDCTMLTDGENEYFILVPGFQLVLEGGNEVLKITVQDETELVDEVETRVVEEREWKNGELIEISRNYFAICDVTKDVYYFGEEVDMFQGGTLTSHSGAWRSGEEDAKFGLIMPGNPVVGMKYYQEIAPGVAMDRAEVLSLDEEFQTPVGSFPGSPKTQEGTALNNLEREDKTYAPGIGLIQDQNLLLMDYGFIDNDAAYA